VPINQLLTKKITEKVALLQRKEGAREAGKENLGADRHLYFPRKTTKTNRSGRRVTGGRGRKGKEGKKKEISASGRTRGKRNKKKGGK